MKRHRILITDDNEENRYFLRALLQGSGYEVALATHGADALSQARQRKPDLIVADIFMPVMDGFTLCREWKKDESLRSVPFLFYTATYTDDRDIDFALSLGADAFIAKPAEPDVLLEKIKAILQNGHEQKPSDIPDPQEEAFLRQYNETLVRKLETKMAELEEANRRLEKDNAERRRAEEELRRTNAFLDSIIDNIPNMLFLKEAEHLRFVRCNRACEELMGIPKEELLGKSDHDFFPAEQADFFLQKDREVLQGKELLDIPEEHLLTRHKGTRILHTWKVPVLNADGRAEYLLGISEDITDRKLAESERERLQAQLTQAQKMDSVGRLAGGVAHDFNNMLGAILGHAEMALEDMPQDHPLHEDLDEIRKATQRSADLTRQLLAFARKQTIAPQVLNLNHSIEGMFQMLRRLIGEDIHIEWKPGRNLGTTRVDPSQVDQILANLCVNARDAITGVGTITIETGNATLDEAYCANRPGATPGDYVFLAVSDTGCGMGPDIQRQIFEQFFTTKGVGRGTGLGLATVYGIVKQNNGFISLYSEVGHGSLFTIYLPRHRGPEESSAPRDTAAPAPHGQETILLVEDELSILRSTQTMLEKLGYRVFGASTPQEALHLAAQNPGRIDLLLTDVILPAMNGRDLARKLLDGHSTMRCLFMSGYTADVIAHHGVLNDGVSFIQKPFTREDLSRKLRQVLEGPPSPLGSP